MTWRIAWHNIHLVDVGIAIAMREKWRNSRTVSQGTELRVGWFAARRSRGPPDCRPRQLYGIWSSGHSCLEPSQCIEYFRLSRSPGTESSGIPRHMGQGATRTASVRGQSAHLLGVASGGCSQHEGSTSCGNSGAIGTLRALRLFSICAMTACGADFPNPASQACTPAVIGSRKVTHLKSIETTGKSSSLGTIASIAIKPSLLKLGKDVQFRRKF